MERDIIQPRFPHSAESNGGGERTVSRGGPIEGEFLPAVGRVDSLGQVKISDGIGNQQPIHGSLNGGLHAGPAVNIDQLPFLDGNWRGGDLEWWGVNHQRGLFALGGPALQSQG